ncbi:hypothetical protein [Nocardiopsis sp. CNT312]|uniref:hypothetical protein n=1 Tax=Nocardiopsis sp. CNT312 TaxID=1137268 RepID=UPI00056B2707|nr:hypothetical protein [Nocardiopsis sp. CNT312]
MHPTHLLAAALLAASASAAAEEEAARDYAEALTATSAPDRMAEGWTSAADGSTAHTYLRHRTYVARAWADGGRPLADETAEPVPDGVRVCRDAPPADGNRCADLTGLAYEDGLVSDFRVDGLDPGPYLVEGGTDPASSAGTQATLLTAYRSVTGPVLVVVLGISTKESVDLDLSGAVYRNPGDDEVRARAAGGERELDAGDDTQAALYFRDVDLGGEVTLTGCLEECSAFVDLTVPVP